VIRSLRFAGGVVEGMSAAEVLLKVVHGPYLASVPARMEETSMHVWE
jgi:hypothetical protein